MGSVGFAGLFFLAFLIFQDGIYGDDTFEKSRSKMREARPQLTRFSFLDLMADDKRDVLEKKQELFDDYGHMRFGKRGEESDDYGHMRFGKRD